MKLATPSYCVCEYSHSAFGQNLDMLVDPQLNMLMNNKDVALMDCNKITFS